MARNNPKVSPEVAVELVELARQMRQCIYGGEGVREWGTKFSRIEADALEVGRELSRLIMEQSVGEQAERLPSPALAEAGSGEWAAVIGTQRLSEKVRGVGFQPAKLRETRQAGSLSHGQMPLLG